MENERSPADENLDFGTTKRSCSAERKTRDGRYSESSSHRYPGEDDCKRFERHSSR